MLVGGALILTLIVVAAITYRPAPIGQPHPTLNWRGTLVPGLMFFAGNAILVGLAGAVAGVVGVGLMLVGIVGLVRNRRAAA